MQEAQLLLVLGRFAEEMRILPMVKTLRSALDKVRAALPEEKQRQLARLQRRVAIIGVPTHPVANDVREAVERAWFEDVPLVITYAKTEIDVQERRVRIESIVLDRAETLLNCIDLEKDAPRQFRLHKVQRARILNVAQRAT